MFNADAFLNQTASAPMATSVTPCPEGEFKFVIDDSDKAIKFNEFTSDKGTFHTMEVLCNCLDDGVKAKLGREKVMVPIKMFLDLDASGSGLSTEPDKNVQLGKLREALGQNDGSPWAPAMLKGKGPFMGKVTQRADKDDPTIKYSEIKRVARLS